MRSHALAYLLQTRTQYHTIVLTGGYKAFRKWARLVYCYTPPNASYTCTQPGTAHSGKRKRELQRQKGKSKKQSQKKAERLQNLTEQGMEKRRIALAKREERLTAQDKAAEEQAIAEDLAARLEWSATFQPGPRIVIVGGRSGSGKTRVLLALRQHWGQQVLDLEGLANHNGSAFGFVGHGEQPTNQQHGNNVAVAWSKFDASRVVFVEDEGTAVGKVSTPLGLYRMMRAPAALIRLVVPQAARISVLLHDYTAVAEKDELGHLSNNWKQRMEKGVLSLKKRLGGDRTQQLIAHLNQGEYSAFAATALLHYDGLYDKHIQNEEGSGSGAGTRKVNTIDVVVDPEAVELDGVAVGRQILEAIAGIDFGVAEE